jgi:phosphoribosyl 1,2-cyclic phosphodiesterase
MRVKLWGTRGSIPTPGPDTVRYGGNTSCVEVEAGRGRLILDAGSGIRKLGLALLPAPALEAALLVTHVHWDHIQGFPFFAPAYRETTTLDIFGLEVAHRKIERLLSDQMEQVYFPVDLSSLRARLRFHDLDAAAFDWAGARIRTIRTNHTTETVGFRVDEGGRSAVYIPDNELSRCGQPGTTPYADFVAFCRGADLLVHDAQYARAAYERFRGWGHSTYEEALDLAIDAGVRRLALFHHDPQTADDEIDRRVAWCRGEVERRGAVVEVDGAREGAVYDLAAAEVPARACWT